MGSGRDSQKMKQREIEEHTEVTLWSPHTQICVHVHTHTHTQTHVYVYKHTSMLRPKQLMMPPLVNAFGGGMNGSSDCMVY